MWEEADRAETLLVLPAVAVAEASHLLGLDDNAWRALLYPQNVDVAPLDSAHAIGTGMRPGSLVARHVVAEAHAVRGMIVTQAPWQYPDDAGPLRPI
jgi:hypothetical protein